jgi:hypothetical protein
MKKLFIILGLVLLQACATPVLDAPPAPCASIQHDCGPARPLNVAGAPADLAPVVRHHG